MKTRPIALALLLSLTPAVALPPRVVYAQQDDSATKMARQRFQEGVSYYDKGQFEMARAAFLQAYALRKHPVVLLNLAQSSLKSGHALEAAHYFQQFLKDYASNATETQRADANKGLSEARTRLGRIDVIGAPSGAEVLVDDERVGTAPLDHSVDVEPGTHTVRLQGAGGEQTQQVTANAGVGATARFNAPAAAPVPAAPAPAPAAPSETPAEPAPAPPEEAAPPPAPANEPGASEASHPWGWFLATGAVMIAGFVTAGVMASEKSSAQNSANAVAQSITAYYQSQHGAGADPSGVCYGTPAPAYQPACAALASDDNNVNSDATFANVGLAVGIVGAVGFGLSTVFLVKSYEHHGKAATTDTPSRITLAPLFGHGLGGAMLGGTF
jgi:tetratricopeptide (TPR) repeat protein